MGLSIWIPRADRAGVLKEWKDGAKNLLERLPLNCDDTTLRTIEYESLRRRSTYRICRTPYWMNMSRKSSEHRGR